MTDASFADGRESPLRLRARDADDLRVISALVQDAVFPAAEMRYDRRRRRFAILLNRFRWEDRPAAERLRRPYERVQALLVVDDVLAAATQGLDPSDRDTVLSVLALDFTPGADTTGRLTLTLAGDGALALEVECLEVALRDVTRPYAAPSGKAPRHPEEDAPAAADPSPGAIPSTPTGTAPTGTGTPADAPAATPTAPRDRDAP